MKQSKSETCNVGTKKLSEMPSALIYVCIKYRLNDGQDKSVNIIKYI
jgi:hypothetical protein